MHSQFPEVPGIMIWVYREDFIWPITLIIILATSKQLGIKWPPAPINFHYTIFTFNIYLLRPCSQKECQKQMRLSLREKVRK